MIHQHPGNQWAQSASRTSGVQIAYQAHAVFSPQLSAWKFILPNGLKIILALREGCPVFAYQTWFAVGSRDENPQQTGMAHLFEHLMFKGTRKHPAGTFDREMEKRGSQTNAATWVDWTYYTQALSSQNDNLAVLASFESDRMSHLILDEQTFRSELEVVKNERRMAVDNSPAGELQETLYALAYHEHPYRWPTLGSMDHLSAASIQDLESFYKRFYAPNNATIVIAGGFDPEETLNILAEKYGHIPPSTIIRRAYPIEPPQYQPREATIHRAVASPLLNIAFKAQPFGTQEYLAQCLLSDILGTGDSARLYQRLLQEEEIVSDINTFVTPFADPGLFEISADLMPDVSAEEVTQAAQDVLQELTHGISSDEYEKVINNSEMAMVEAFRDVEQLAEALGHHETVLNDFSKAFTYLDDVKRIDPALITHVAQQTFREDQRTVVSCLSPTAAKS